MTLSDQCGIFMHWHCAPFSLDTILFNLLAAHSLLHTPYSAYHTLPHIFFTPPPCFTTHLPDLLTCIPLYGRSHPDSQSLQGWPTLRVTRTLTRFPLDHPEPTMPTLGCSMMRCLARAQPSGHPHAAQRTLSAPPPLPMPRYAANVPWMS